MKSLGKVNAVLTGKAVSFAHGSKSAIDKKVVDGSLRLVLLNVIGCAQVSSDIDPDMLEQTLASCR